MNFHLDVSQLEPVVAEVDMPMMWHYYIPEKRYYRLDLEGKSCSAAIDGRYLPDPTGAKSPVTRALFQHWLKVRRGNNND